MLGVKKIVNLFVIFSFIVTNLAFGVSPDPAHGDLSSDVRDGLFEVPSSLGYVLDSHTGTSGKVVINIQDAHCDYYAQHAINGIIKYLNEKYGTSLICLEGGSGEYDLTPFAEIKDAEMRLKTADFFMKEGLLNGSEYSAVENPGNFLLWGVENVDLYLANLKVYRESLGYTERILRYVENVSSCVEKIKKEVYSKSLAQFDSKYSARAKGILDIKSYVPYLAALAKRYDVSLGALPNIRSLNETLAEEEQIDFKKANAERDALMGELRNKISQRELEELMAKTAAFKSGALTQKGYYDHIAAKALEAGISPKGYPFLERYVAYVSKYSSIDKSLLFKELGALEDMLLGKLCGSEEESLLAKYGKDVTLIKKVFDVSLTKDDFDYFKDNVKGSKISEILSFLKKEAALYDIDTSFLDENSGELAKRLGEMEKFYDLSFERDKFFVSEIQEKISSSGLHSAVIVSGGFHSENLSLLMEKEGFSYVTIMPVFKDEEGYKNPYFDILSGSRAPFAKLFQSVAASATLQVASPWNKTLGDKVFEPEVKEDAVRLIKNVAKEIPVASDQLPDITYAAALEAASKPDISQKDLEDMGEDLIKKYPASWVVFADGMAGRAREKYLGRNIMDRLSPEASAVVQRTARERGIFAYHYGKDEHAFIFPEKYSEDDIAKFFVEVTEKLSEEPKYVLYEFNAGEDGHEKVRNGISKEIAKISKKDLSKMVFEDVGKKVHLLIPSGMKTEYTGILKGRKGKTKKMYPFLFPAGGVKKSSDSDNLDYREMLKMAETRAGRKWQENELKPLSGQRMKDIFGYLAEESGNVQSVIRRDLVGLPKDVIRLEIVKGEPKKEPSMVSVLGDGKKKTLEKMGEDKKDYRSRLIANVQKIISRTAPNDKKAFKYGSKDDYTGYDSQSLEVILKELFKMTPAERKELLAGEVIMVRGPPVDFYAVLIDTEGAVTVLNVDMMIRASGTEKKKEEELKEGLGRPTDYLIANGPRMFPFKALNSYVGHDIGNEYILATFLSIFEEFERGAIDPSGIEKAIAAASAKAGSLINPGVFEKVVGKSAVKIMFEAHVVTEKHLGEIKSSEKAKKLMGYLEAMRSVRDPEVVGADGKILDAGGKNAIETGEEIAARVRTYEKDKAKEYRRDYLKKQVREAKAGREELEKKNSFFRVLLAEKKNELSVKAQYSASREVLREVKNMAAPLIVFKQCPVENRGLETNIINETRREIVEKYNADISNIRVKLYYDREDLEIKKADADVTAMMAQELARAVVFCDSKSGIHPKGNDSEDIFGDFKTVTGDPKVYYFQEDLPKLEKEDGSTLLIGPHIALAMGIREIKADKDNPALIQAVYRLMSEISGSDLGISESNSRAIMDYIDRILSGVDALKIRKIDFEAVQDRIKAEEAALKSL